MRNDFIFDGRYGSDFGLVFCNVDGGTNSQTVTISNAEIETFRPANADKNYFTADSYDSVLTKTLQVCKMENCEIVPLTDYDVEEIARWLCRDDGYHTFAFVRDSDSTVEYNARIDINTIEIEDQIIALELTVTTDSQFGYTAKTNRFTLNADETACVTDHSSKTGEIPVNLQLTCKSDGNYVIRSGFNGMTKSICLDNCKSGEVITITDMCVITTTLPSHDITDDFNYVFPKLYNTISNRNNTFSVNLPCDLTITYKLRRKVGI